MFSPVVRHVGDRVAAVAAEDAATAAEALRLIRVQYEVLPAVLSMDQAMAANATVVHADQLDRIVYQFPIGAEPGRNLAASASGSMMTR